MNRPGVKFAESRSSHSPAVVLMLKRSAPAAIVVRATGSSVFLMLRKSSAVSMMVVRNHTQMLLATMWVRPKRTNALCLLIVIYIKIKIEKVPLV